MKYWFQFITIIHKKQASFTLWFFVTMYLHVFDALSNLNVLSLKLYGSVVTDHSILLLFNVIYCPLLRNNFHQVPHQGIQNKGWVGYRQRTAPSVVMGMMMRWGKSKAPCQLCFMNTAKHSQWGAWRKWTGKLWEQKNLVYMI